MKEIAKQKGHAVLCLENKTEATAFMYFLRKELKRHQQDISQLSDDISSLSEIWDIPIPDMDAEIWIDATYKSEVQATDEEVWENFFGINMVDYG